MTGCDPRRSLCLFSFVSRLILPIVHHSFSHGLHLRAHGGLAYRLQADRLGELDNDSRRLLDRIASGSAERIDRLVADFNLPRTELRPGTLLTREWDGHLQRVMVLADGFSWNGETYRSLSKVAFAMTGTRWSGPRFFGLDQPPSERRP